MAYVRTTSRVFSAEHRANLSAAKKRLWAMNRGKMMSIIEASGFLESSRTRVRHGYTPSAETRAKRGATLRATLARYGWRGPVGTCGLCGRESTRLFKDHDHRTKVRRGLICIRCNTGLGHFQDSVAELKKAIAYLERWS